MNVTIHYASFGSIHLMKIKYQGRNGCFHSGAAED
uniref:Uncharacterized protein n=1 Tax=Arundo donax TaxID=35708 RepID=A0A0A9CEE4_ARUDO